MRNTANRAPLMEPEHALPPFQGNAVVDPGLKRDSKNQSKIRQKAGKSKFQEEIKYQYIV